MSGRIKKMVGIVVLMMVCSHYSSQQVSGDRKEKPEVNFYGTLLDTSGHRYPVENITIGGRYKDITVYQKPANNDINPDINKTKFDLADITMMRSIWDKTPQADGAIKKILTYDKRDYIEIEITLHDQLIGHRYIIERYKKIYCDEVSGITSLEKEISFEALNELQIDGYRDRASHHIACDSMLTQTQSILHSIQQVAEQLPEKETKNLKDQILNLIDELKIKIKNWFT